MLQQCTSSSCKNRTLTWLAEVQERLVGDGRANFWAREPSGQCVTGGRLQIQTMRWQNGWDDFFRCGGENMAARVMAYCLACMEAVAKEEEER